MSKYFFIFLIFVILIGADQNALAKESLTNKSLTKKLHTRNLLASNLSPGLTLEQLGEKLFFDPRLSGNNTMSCASCHNPNKGWTDGLPTAIGENGFIGSRRTPTLIETVHLRKYFWDGRAESLEQQALGPLTAANEMNQNLDLLLTELTSDSGYVFEFKNLFADQKITISNLATAIAAFERTITHQPTRYEKWLAGDRLALSESEVRGQQLFHSRSLRCNLCHKNPDWTDGLFWDIGLPGEDLGRGVYEPDNLFSQHGFKTPTLWGVGRRGPYFHDGSARTLEDVVEHYNQGGKVERDSVHIQIHPLEMTAQEKADLVAFLRSL